MQPSETSNTSTDWYFWAIGDMHFRAIAPWHEFHTQRLGSMFDDLHAIWQAEGTPAFCVSPGDLIETCALENYQQVKAVLATQLGEIPFYPGIGNHEYYGPNGEDPLVMGARFEEQWGTSLRYSWHAGNIVGIMLDYPDPRTLEDSERVYISPETLTFLDETLAANAERSAMIFLHCPLHNTVLDRDEVKHRDYNSLQHFFAPENSQAVRDILARHENAKLFFSGHTHSGWEAPNLVVTEELGGHAVTFVNLMSPWYTGTHTGPRLSADFRSFKYISDEPDIIPSFSIRIKDGQAHLRVRDHRSQKWLKEWIVAL